MPTLPASVLRFTHDLNSKKDVGDLKRSLTWTDMRVAVSIIIPEQYSSTSVHPWDTWEFTAIKTIPSYFPINPFSSDHSYKPEITFFTRQCTGSCTVLYWQPLRPQKKIKKKNKVPWHSHFRYAVVHMHCNRSNLCQAGNNAIRACLIEISD